MRADTGSDTTTRPTTRALGAFLRSMREVFWFLAAIVVIELIEAAKMSGWWYVIPTPF